MRRPLLEKTPHGQACLAGALKQLAGARAERLKRLDEVVAKLAAENRAALDAALRAEHERVCAAWPAARARLAAAGDVECAEKEAFLAAWNAARDGEYVVRVQRLPAEVQAAGTAWLQKIVESAGAPAGAKAGMT